MKTLFYSSTCCGDYRMSWIIKSIGAHQVIHAAKTAQGRASHCKAALVQVTTDLTHLRSEISGLKDLQY